MEQNFDMLLHNNVAEAITDVNLNILHANELFFRICGDNYFFSFQKFIHEDYLEIFRRSISIAKSCGHSSLPAKVLHYISEYESRCFDDYIEIVYIKESEQFSIRLYEIRNILSRLGALVYDVKKYRQIFTVENDVIFEYNSDTNCFEMYLISEKQNIVIYDGDFDLWVRDMINGGYVNKGDIEIFKTFCNSIKSSEKQCSGKFRSRIVGKGGNEDLNRVTLCGISDINGTRHMVGTWNIFNELTQKKVDHLMDDIFLDPLTLILSISLYTFRSNFLDKSKVMV